MEGPQRSKVERLFEEALGRPEEEREAFLKETCGDATLRKEVSSLVEAYEEAPAFFEGLASSVVAPMLDEEEEGPAASNSSDPLELEGASLGRYQVEEHLGSGGMGIVYRARDTELGRTVALKFLPPHLSWHEEAEERFVREARAAAALDHPNVATVYEIGEAALGKKGTGRRFIAMAYYEGETLKEKLSREGVLPVEEALDYAKEIAEGLGRAHEAGIVHRDIKPANVMVTGRGRVKLLDFGIAKLKGTQGITETGDTLGTLAYMAPEQIQGKDIDGGADLFSLGVVLYEMLTGERPFQGERKTVILHAVLHEEPTPIGQRRSEVPAELERIVDRLLAKDPKERYPSAEALLEDLQAVGSGASAASSAPAFLPAAIRPSGLPRRWLAGGAVLLAVLVFVGAWWFTSESLSRGSARGGEAERERSVAVLPFEVSGSGAETWRDGMVTMLSTGLDGAAGLRAIPERTIFAAWAQADTARDESRSDPALETARRVGARYAVAGSAVTLGGELQLAASVHETGSGRRLGKAQVRGPANRVMALADELTRDVLGVLLEESEAAIPSVNLASLTTESLPALKAFLRGERHFRTGKYEAAIEDYRAATDQDSTFALAYARLSHARTWIGPLEAIRQALEQAYQLSDRLPERERRIIRATYLANRDLTAADTLRKLNAIYPDDPTVWYRLGEMLYHGVPPFHGAIPRGLPEAEAAFSKAVQLDSGVAQYHHHLVDLAFNLHHDSASTAERIAAHPGKEYRQVYRLALDLVFGAAEERETALARIEGFSLSDISPPTFAGILEQALRYPTDGALEEKVLLKLKEREDLGRTDHLRFTNIWLVINGLKQGQVEKAITRLQNEELVPPYPTCLPAWATTLGIPVPDSLLRARLEPSRIEDGASIDRLTCAGIYLLEQGRDEELGPLIARIRAEGEQPEGQFDPEMQRAVRELKGYRAWKAGDLERATELWDRSNESFYFGALWRGDLYRKLGELEKAEGWYLAAWWHPATHERLGRLYEEMDQPEKAAEAYERFIEAWAEADPALQEQVEAARARLKGLAGEGVLAARKSGNGVSRGDR